MRARRVLTTIIRKMSLQSSAFAARRVKSICRVSGVLGGRRLCLQIYGSSFCVRVRRVPSAAQNQLRHTANVLLPLHVTCCFFLFFFF